MSYISAAASKNFNRIGPDVRLPFKTSLSNKLLRKGEGMEGEMDFGQIGFILLKVGAH
jgi:hypothetical protein